MAWAGLAAVVVALGLPASATAEELTAATATATFRDYLTSTYGRAFTEAEVSYSKCANLFTDDDGVDHADCLAQFGTGRTWRLLSAGVEAAGSAADPSVSDDPFTRKWVRKMRKQSRSCLRSWGVKGTLYSNLGTCSANLALHYYRGRTFSGGTGTASFPTISRYRCRGHGRTVRCTNALGDAIRWVRPRR
jgi:hypothetical protein